MTTTYEGPELGDPLNDKYNRACKAGDFDTLPDCGHKTCGLLCDPLIRQIRNRRDTGSDVARGDRRRKGH